MKILLAEDDFVTRKFMVSFLSKYGECDVTVDGMEAVDAFMMALEDGEPYDLVCLDIMMPVMDGFGVLEYLVEHKYIEDIPVFIISADTSDKSLSRAYDLGAADVIAKPFNIRFVRRRINNIIELYDQRRQLKSIVDEQNKIIGNRN